MNTEWTTAPELIIGKTYKTNTSCPHSKEKLFIISDIQGNTVFYNEIIPSFEGFSVNSPFHTEIEECALPKPTKDRTGVMWINTFMSYHDLVEDREKLQKQVSDLNKKLYEKRPLSDKVKEVFGFICYCVYVFYQKKIKGNPGPFS